MTSNIRFTQDGEILGLAKAPTIKFKLFGIFLNFPILELVSAESLSDQYFLPQDGVPKLQEAVISRNASHFVFASETFASEQKTEEFLDVDKFSDFY